MSQQPTWPTVDDIVEELAAAGIVVVGGNTVKRSLRAAIEAFESATGYSPFLAEAEATPRTISTGDGEWLDLLGGAVEIVDISVGDTVLTPGDGGFCGLTSWYKGSQEPGGPITYIRLRYPQCGNWRDVTVTARWGYCDSLPALVESAVIGHAAGAIAERFTRTEDGRQLEEVQEADVKQRWATSVTERRAIFERWQNDWNRAVSRYKLPGGIA